MTSPSAKLAAVVAYRDSLRGIIPQLKAIEARLPDGHDASPLHEAMKFYGAVADDLTKILNGEDLKPFRIEGVIPQ